MTAYSAFRAETSLRVLGDVTLKEEVTRDAEFTVTARLGADCRHFPLSLGITSGVVIRDWSHLRGFLFTDYDGTTLGPQN